MPLVPTDDDTTGVAPAFWTPSVTKAADEELPGDEEPARGSEEPAPDGEDPSAGEDSTADTQFLASLDGDLPVFLDTTGRRRRLVRALLWVVCLTGLVYATVLVVSLLGHGARSNAATEYGTRAPSPAATGAPVASTSARLERSGDAPAAAAPRDPASRPSSVAPSAAQPAAPAPSDATSPDAAPSDAAPSTPAGAAPAPAPSPSSEGGLVKGLWDTLFPWAS